jgi:CheY-like chemotaxis protein
MKTYEEILLIEDDRLFQFITQAMIEKKGLANKVICKSNGEMALAYLKDTYLTDNKLTADYCSDIILLDINMPVMDGFEFLQALKDMGAESLIHFKVVVLSSSIDARDREKAKAFGVKGYLEKPLTIEKILSVFQHNALMLGSLLSYFL